MKSVPALVAAALAVSGCGAAVSADALATAGRLDSGSPPVTDGGTDAGGTDGGSGDLDGGTSFQGEITYTETGYDLLAVDSTGTAYGVNLNDSGAEIWASSDGRAWQKRGSIANGASFWNLAPLADGTLLADAVNGAGHAVARSTDRGVTWMEVLATGPIARSPRTASRSWTGRSISSSTRPLPGPARPSGSGSPRTGAPPGQCSIPSRGTATGTGWFPIRRAMRSGRSSATPTFSPGPIAPRTAV